MHNEKDVRDIATQADAALLETVLVKGDLKDLSPAQRLDYYSRVCDSLGLNPLTQPFQYITLNNRLVLYAGKGAAEQTAAESTTSRSTLSRR